MNRQFYFETAESFTGKTSYQENEKKYLLTGLDSHNIIIFSDRIQTQLVCPDDNFILANCIKFRVSTTFVTPTSNLEFKPDFLKKGRHSFSALLVKDNSQIKKVELETPLGKLTK